MGRTGTSLLGSIPIFAPVLWHSRIEMCGCWPEQLGEESQRWSLGRAVGVREQLLRIFLPAGSQSGCESWAVSLGTAPAELQAGDLRQPLSPCQKQSLSSVLAESSPCLQSGGCGQVTPALVFILRAAPRAFAWLWECSWAPAWPCVTVPCPVMLLLRSLHPPPPPHESMKAAPGLCICGFERAVTLKVGGTHVKGL